MFIKQILSLAVVLGVSVKETNAQVSLDVGDEIGIAGSSSGSGSSWTVSGAGRDIWGSTDGFHYLHFGNRTADVTVTTKINTFTCSGCESWRKAGIMFRSGLGPSDVYSMIQLTGWGVAHQSRYQGSKSKHDSYSTSNVWLKLVKEGNTVTSYVKKDGEYGFMKFHEENIDFGGDYYVGLAVTSHDTGRLGTIDVDEFSISDEVFSFDYSTIEVGDTGDDIWFQEVAPGMFQVTAAGTDISGTSEDFGFVAEEHSGDITATLHLEKLVRQNNKSKGGLMIRASSAVDSPHVSLLVTAGDGITMISRSTVGGDTASLNVGVWHEDMELKLVKTGNSVQCLYKHDTAPTWYEIGTVTAELDTAGTYLVGQALSSAEKSTRTKLTTGLVVVETATV